MATKNLSDLMDSTPRTHQPRTLLKINIFGLSSVITPSPSALSIPSIRCTFNSQFFLSGDKCVEFRFNFQPQHTNDIQ